jgi:acetyltransferase-like isoleucine patch superfamily enzyme
MATILIVPELVSYWFRAVLLGRDRALQGSSEMLSLIPGMLGEYLRRAFYSCVLARCHPSATISFGVIFSKAGAWVDENVYIGPRCHLGLVHLERDVLLAAGVHVTSGAQTHGTVEVGTPIREQPGSIRRVRIGMGTWIGSAAIVMADVGSDTVVGAGAVVTQALGDQIVAAGVPARMLRSRKQQPPAVNERFDDESPVLANPCVERDNDGTA